MTAAQLKRNNEIAAIDAQVAETMPQEKRIAYYYAAYEQGRAAYLRGDDKHSCPFTVGVWGTLGVRGWNAGWGDEHGAAWLEANP